MKHAFVFAILSFLMPAFAFAQPGTGQSPMPGRGMMEHRPMTNHMGTLIDKLKLTDEQKEQLQNLHFAAQEKIIAQRAKIAESRLELRKLVASTAPDQKAINAKIEEIATEQASLKQIHTGVWFEFNKSLNPDQQKIWKGMLEGRLMSGNRGRMARQFHGAGATGGMGAGRGMMQCPCMR